MISPFIDNAHRGDPVFITDVRAAFESAEAHEEAACVLTLPDGKTLHTFRLRIPHPQTPDEEQFLRDYVHAEIYNTLTSLGGRRMDVGVSRESRWLHKTVENLDATFGINASRADRTGYGRVVNVIDRMLGALVPPREPGGGQELFRFNVASVDTLPPAGDREALETAPADVFTRVTQGLEGRLICGLDIGGTDIKAALAANGRLTALKEFDWFPEGYATAEEIIDPIVMLVRYLRARAAAESGNAPAEGSRKALAALDRAEPREAPYDRIRDAVTEAEDALETFLPKLDAVGLCFPDVVVKNKIVGGEVPKTRGMRSNAALDYETEFAKITALDERLREYCRPDGVVMNTNDGPMAAFTAAVEMAGSGAEDQVRGGVFAHSLGTDLGTGWVHTAGRIPELPLEVYNLIIDIGSYPERSFNADDVRSINNTNTGLPGTLQKYTSQSGVFRLAAKTLPDTRPDVYRGLFETGLFRSEHDPDGNERIVVPTQPEDRRKACLAHMMELCDQAHDEAIDEIFRSVGRFLGVTWKETEHILNTGLKVRYLFGRLVKVRRCFELIQEGAEQRAPGLALVAADSEMAFTPLMKQLDADPHYTVAQFGQAIGAVYFGNLGLMRS